MGIPQDHLSWAHPVVREWFITRFGTPTEPQIAGWPHILARRNTLISAPTGSGKTLAAFLACIDSLVRQSLTGDLRERTQVLYISPLKALGNDVQKNLDQPLFEIQQLAAARGYLMPAIRTMVRTGDTPARDRVRMLKLPPHILVTTPESLYILLTAARSRETLRHIHTVIVDEIHALVPNKRGAHLALSLERLDAITHLRPNRIGLSATQRPLSLVAEFLSGSDSASDLKCHPDSGSDLESKCHPDSGFDLESKYHPDSGFDFESKCHPDSGSDLESKCHRDSGFDLESKRHPDSGFDLESKRHPHSGFDLESKCHPERSEGPQHSSNLDNRSKLSSRQSMLRSALDPATAGQSTHIDIEQACTPVTVVVPAARPLDLAIELPSTELGPIASNEMWDEIYQRLEQLALGHRSTLVFVNTRRLVERISHRLSERMGEEHVAAHHGSLSRHLRLESERRLKQGECRILIATASLELGIDIGNVDLVCQIGSPRAIGVALQRVGRAGHWRGAIPKGRFFATTRDELVECAAILRAIRQGDLDTLILPEAPLDILAQQIVAACAADEWSEDDLFALVRRARNYRDLPRESFDKVLAMLSDGISAKRGRFGAYLYRDQVNHRLRARRGSRLAAITSGGAIPETALLNVVALPTETVIGTLDEDFAIESHAGDIMLLGNTSWRIHRVEARTGRVLVEDAHGQPPTIPFWRGEAPARTFELSAHVGELRQLISDSAPADAPAPADGSAVALAPALDLKCHPERSEGPQHSSDLQQRSRLFNQQAILQSSRVAHICPSLANVGQTQCTEQVPHIDRVAHICPSLANVGQAKCMQQESIASFLDPDSLRQLTTYIREGRAVLGAVPTQRCIIAERFFDEAGGMQLIIHAPFGARINRAWGLALRKRFCRSFNFELQASATDDGINIALAEQHSFPLADVFHFLQPETVEEILQQAVLTGSPIFATRFRWDANRSLALLRFQNGKKVPPQIQRMRSDDLLAAVFPDVAACFENIQGDIQIPDHPLVEEVMKDVMHEAMDIDGLRRVLQDIRDGTIQTIAVDTPAPSQFAHEILNANPYAFLDDAPLEERRARAVQLRRTLPASILEEAGRLDPSAIAQVIEESRPDLRDPDDLHDLLQTLILFPAPATELGCHPERSEGPLPQHSSDLAQRSKLFNQQSTFSSSIPATSPPSTHIDLSLDPASSGDPARVPHLRVTPSDAKVGSNMPASHDFELRCHPERSEGSLQGSNLDDGSKLSSDQSILQPPCPPASISVDPFLAFTNVNLLTAHPGQLTRWMHHLVETRRAVFAFAGDREFWVASEKAKAFTSIYLDASFSPEPPDLQLSICPLAQPPEAILDRALLGWMQHLGPVTTKELVGLFSIDSSANPSVPCTTIAGVVNSASETIARNANPCPVSPASVDASLLRLEVTGAILRGHFRRSAGDLEWCDRRLLARIHRLTVATLRKQIEPVTAAQFMHWLLRWQHLAPGSALRGEHGLQEALRQLQGFEIPASAWERHILARRVAAYDGAALDRLCLMGVAGWGRLSPHPATLEDAASVSDRRAVDGSVPAGQTPGRSRRIVPTAVAPITFFLREDCAWMQPRPHDDAAERGFSASAQGVLDALRRRGASFFAELQRITALERLEVERGLWELVAAGFVTADAFDNLRGLISKSRLAAVSSRTSGPRHTAGRWSLLQYAEDAAMHADATPNGEKPNESAPRRASSAERVEATCWMLLRRYGIVFRELLARETNLPKWRELQWAFRRIEERGDVRGGRFVSGFVGEQFALPVAVESIRETRNLPVSNELITISAADPLNLAGILVPGDRVPAIAARCVSFRAGVYVPDLTAPPNISVNFAADESFGYEGAV